MNNKLENVAVVLYEPQDDINIGTAVRACKNFGITDIRLVRPRTANPDAILISAPNAQDLISELSRYEDLDEALHDAVLVLGTTARERKGSWDIYAPGRAAEELMKFAADGKVAFLFGREDSGLPNSALDRCHGVVHVPTAPGYSSLNLGQAVLLCAWEVFQAADAYGRVEREEKFELAEREQVERMLGFAHDALERIEFFKSDGAEHVMRSVRSVLSRARLNRRELSIWFGIFREIPNYIDRHQGNDNDTR